MRVQIFCDKPNFNHMLYRPLQRKISELNVYCSNRNEGCSEIMTLASINSHLATACVFVEIDCPNECGLPIMRKDKEEHISNHCIKRIEYCSHCKLETTYDLMTDHLKVCDKVPVSCPRDCKENLLRGDLQKHNEVCPNMVVKCPFFEAGCTKVLPRKELDCHIETASTAHLLKFMASYNVLKADYEAIKADCDATK